MNSNRTLSGELEIDLIQVMRDLLLQWKAILAVMIIFGLLTPGVMYIRQISAYKAEVATQKELQEKLDAARNGEKADDADLYDELSDAEEIAVESAVLKQYTLNRKREYAENSLLMTIDASKARRLYVTYTVSASTEYLNTVIDMYLSAMGDNDFKKSMTKTLNKYLKDDSTEKYVSELISASSSGGASGGATNGIMKLTVTVLLPNEKTDSGVVANVIRDYMNTKSNHISAIIGPHQLNYINYEEKVSDDQTLLTTQNDTKAQLLTMQNELNTATDAFSEMQQQIFTSKTNIELEMPENFNLDTDDDGIMDAVDEDENGIADKEERLYNLDTDGDGKNDAIDLNENGIDDSKEMEEVLTLPRVSIKYAVLGLMIGLVLYGGIYLLMLILRPAIRTGSELSDMLGIKSFGNIHSEPKKFGLFCDKWVYNLLYHKKKSSDELMSDVAERIDIFAKYHELGELVLLSVDPESGEVIGHLQDKLTAQNLTVSHIDLWDGDKATDLAEERMSGSNNFIICLMPNATRIADVDKVLTVASEYEKSVVGTVAL